VDPLSIEGWHVILAPFDFEPAKDIVIAHQISANRDRELRVGDIRERLAQNRLPPREELNPADCNHKFLARVCVYCAQFEPGYCHDPITGKTVRFEELTPMETTQ